jgi:hypothetical protein
MIDRETIERYAERLIDGRAKEQEVLHDIAAGFGYSRVEDNPDDPHDPNESQGWDYVINGDYCARAAFGFSQDTGFDDQMCAHLQECEYLTDANDIAAMNRVWDAVAEAMAVREQAAQPSAEQLAEDARRRRRAIVEEVIGLAPARVLAVYERVLEIYEGGQ